MNYMGILIGVITFLCIGVFHPIVIKAEYYFTYKCWPVFMVFGIVFLAFSVFAGYVLVSCILAVVGISCLWSILELFAQRERVRRGWFPSNPKREPSQDAGDGATIKEVGIKKTGLNVDSNEALCKNTICPVESRVKSM